MVFVINRYDKSSGTQPSPYRPLVGLIHFLYSINEIIMDQQLKTVNSDFLIWQKFSRELCVYSRSTFECEKQF